MFNQRSASDRSINNAPSSPIGNGIGGILPSPSSSASVAAAVIGIIDPSSSSSPSLTATIANTGKRRPSIVATMVASGMTHVDQDQGRNEPNMRNQFNRINNIYWRCSE
jgi:hypothetical protein